MRYIFPVLSALWLAVFASAALADDAPQTVSDYANVMNDIAGQLDVQNAARQKAGDMAAAQRLVLVAAMIRRAGEEFRGAEQSYLTEAASGLEAPVPARLKAAIATAQQAETLAADQPAFVEQAQKAFNGLIAALPVTIQHPVVYGLLSRDLSAGALPSDIVVYGYRLVDPLYKVNPVVLFGKVEISAAVVHDDRIDVTLPEDVKKAVNFAPSPCDSRPSFGIRVRSLYAKPHGVWPVVWHTQVPTNADFYALPTPIFYTAKVIVSMETSTQKTVVAPFLEKSNFAAADCDQTSKVEVIVPLPANAKNVTCAADWVDLSGAQKLSSHCAAGASSVRAVGEITGGSRVCSPEKLCSCPSQAQGFLEAKGSYEVQAPAGVVEVDTEATPLTFPAGGIALGRVTAPQGAKLRHIALSLSRRACPQPVDSIDLNIGDDPEGRASGVSKTGAFRASIRDAGISVGASDAFNVETDKTP
ncbi:MAG TPA: hypothetical protein VN715_08325 [Roseiarcus sp.]|nr:hypothetical protein [Roseiarcus sp.]